MVAIITEKFKLHNASQFVESFTEAAASTYYLFIGKSTAFSAANDGTGASDTSPPTPPDSVSDEFYFWDQMLGAKKISSSDILQVIPRRDWSNETSFDMYKDDYSSLNVTDSGAASLYTSTFYFRTSANRVYKVISNIPAGEFTAAAAYSGSEPTSESTSLFTTGGYVLKYMYTISASNATKFLTTDFMPVVTDSTVSAAASDGAVESFRVTNLGAGCTDGTYFAAIYGDGANNGTADGAVIRIVISSGKVQSFGTNSSTTSGIFAAGSSYTYGTINVTAGFTFSDSGLTSASAIGGTTDPVFDVIISPKGGHGTNGINELGGHFVMTNTTLTGAEGDDISSENDFRNVGLVVDPTDFGTSTVATSATARTTYALKFPASGTGSVSGTFSSDEKITQASTAAIGKVVEYDSSLDILYYQQERHADFGTNSSTGAYVAFSGANAVTGASSGASGTPDAGADSAVTLANASTITFADGYANPELAADSGNIIYKENRRPISRASDQTEDIKIIVEF